MLIGLAFWLGLCWAFRWMNMPLASFVAAVLIWAVAALFVARTIDALRWTGDWPLM